MTDFAPLGALGTGIAAARPPADPAAGLLAPVAATSNALGPQARMDTAPPPPRPQSRAPAAPESRLQGQDPPKLDDHTLVGPTPAFQANVLELERDLRRAIERLEAERGRVEAEAAFKIRKAEDRVAAGSTEVPAPEAPDPAPAIPKAAVPEVEPAHPAPGAPAAAAAEAGDDTGG